MVRKTILGQRVKAHRNGRAKVTYLRDLGVFQPSKDSKPSTGGWVNFLTGLEEGTTNKQMRRPGGRLQAFLNALRQDDAFRGKDLEDMLRRSAIDDTSPPPDTQKPFCIGCGHCLWSALILLSMDTLRKRVAPSTCVTSFSRKPTGPNSKPAAVWLGGTEQYGEEINRGVPGPTWEKCKPKTADTCEPFAADNIIQMLIEEDIQVAAVPGDILSDYPNTKLKSIARIVYSTTGCQLVLSKKHAKALLGSHNVTFTGTRTVADFVKKTLSEKRGQIGVHSKTVSTHYFDAIMEDCGGNLSCVEIHPSDMARHSWNWFLDQHSGGDFLGILSWDPHAQWLARNSAKRELVAIPLYYDRKLSKAEKLMTFNLVVLEKSFDSDGNFRSRLRELLAAMQPALDKVEGIRKLRPGSSKDRKLLETYFDMTTEELVASLNEINFDVLPDLSLCFAPQDTKPLPHE